MNRNRLDLIFGRRDGKCCMVEYLRFLNPAINEIIKQSGAEQQEHFLKCALSGLRQFFATESPLKMMKNAIYFTLKPLFFLKINGLIRKIKLISKFMTSQPG